MQAPTTSETAAEPATEPATSPAAAPVNRRRVSGSAICAAVLRHPRFQVVSMTIIVLNGAILGAMTFPALEHSEVLVWADHVCLAFFTFEVVVGIASFGRRPWRYFGEGWNVFDFAIVVASFLPGLRENVTILRMLRLARVVRIFKSMPSLRIILVAAGKALPKSAGVFALTGLTMYLWAMIGWIAFGDTDEEHFGTVGRALLNLFQLVAFDDMGNVIRESMTMNLWTLPYYIVFILFGAFILVNIMIGVVLASMEEAQKLDDEDGQVSADTTVLLERIDRLQATVDKLAAERGNERGFTPFR
ncbi:ion transporter [Glycomyces paridis]|uniref:Ion transporter n=1 Tax=Glycomyces paridis TaxID=2126555 RepID=A0A4S8PTV1_9ACTN|nr:ion transporter [Glycomyces paridis]THV31444.1 ion transporter [Glycomyces paridis]